MNATATKSEAFTLTRYNASQQRSERVEFIPAGSLVHVRFDAFARRLGYRPYRQLTLGLDEARRCWVQVRKEGWKTFSEMFPATGPSCTGNYTGD